MKKKDWLHPEATAHVKPIKRNKGRLREAVVLRILTIIHWDLVVEEGPVVVMTALHQAREFGQVWAGMEPKGDGGLVDYCEFVVSAAKDAKVLNEVEWKLWFSNRKDDPRLLEFRRGFLEARKA